MLRDPGVGLIADVVNVDFKKGDEIEGRDAEKKREKCAEKKKGKCAEKRKDQREWENEGDEWWTPEAIGVNDGRSGHELGVMTELMKDVMACYLLLLETGERDLFGGGGDWEDWGRWMKWECMETCQRTKIILPDPWIPWDVQMECLRDFEEGIARSTDFRNGYRRAANGQLGRAAEDGYLRRTADRYLLAAEDGHLRAENG